MATKRGEDAMAACSQTLLLLLLVLTCWLSSTFVQASGTPRFEPLPEELLPSAKPAPPPPPPPAIVATNASADMEALDDKYRLHVGDCLSFRIIEDRFRTLTERFRSPEDRKDPKILTVAASGDLEVPYIGRFPAVDKTCKQLAREIQVELEKDYYHHATVIIAVDLLTKSRGKVYLSGEVRGAGSLDIPGDEVFTLTKAIMLAGGFGEFADRRRVKILRKTGPDRNTGQTTATNAIPGKMAVQTFEVDVNEILKKGRPDGDIVLESGDFIIVPRRMINF